MDEGDIIEEEVVQLGGGKLDFLSISDKGKGKFLSENNFADADDDFLKSYLSVKLDFKEKDCLISGLNYDVWVLRMRGFFREVRLWSWVDGTCIRLGFIITRNVVFL